MAKALREGGVYKVGDKYVDAEGKEVKKPTKAELAGAEEEDTSPPAGGEGEKAGGEKK